MSKNKLHLLVDVLAYLVMLALTSTGLLLAYTMPPGTGCDHGGGEGALTLLGRSSLRLLRLFLLLGDCGHRQREAAQQHGEYLRQLHPTMVTEPSRWM